MENTDKHRKIRDKPKDGEGRRTQQTGTEMGYPASDRYKIRHQETGGKVSESEKGRMLEPERASPQFPARPGQEQYGWEEPRVVGDSDSRSGNAGDTGKSREESGERLKNKDNKATQSKLGGTIDGPKSGVEPIANRVDRLRLLGNGVLPDTCERAIRILLEEIHE